MGSQLNYSQVGSLKIPKKWNRFFRNFGILWEVPAPLPQFIGGTVQQEDLVCSCPWISTFWILTKFCFLCLELISRLLDLLAILNKSCENNKMANLVTKHTKISNTKILEFGDFNAWTQSNQQKQKNYLNYVSNLNF
jgi:hypothetical protein